MRLTPLAVLLALPPVIAQSADIPLLDEIRVTAQRSGLMPIDAATTQVQPGVQDVSSTLATLPGAAVVRNGPLTGIVQVRGLTGDRVNVLVDGMDITPACPNHMDPPLHYAAPADTAALTLVAGGSPVSSGGDSLGASVVLRSNLPAFAEGEAWQAGGRVNAGFSGAHDGWDLGVTAQGANQVWALAYAGSRSVADDLGYADGEVADTGYETTRHKLSLSHATAGGRLDATVGQHRTRDAGTPALPMDMVKDDADWVNLAWAGKMGTLSVKMRAYWHDIEHLMDNYSLRPVPVTVPATMRMYAPADSTDTGFSAALEEAALGGRLRYGLDWSGNDFSAYQWNDTMNVFNADILKNASRDRLGLYGEWEGSLAGRWRANLGLRSDTVRMDTGDVSGSGLTVADAAAFNARSHQRTDHNWDWSTLFQYAATERMDYELGLTRKTRSPSLLERYEWTPLNASAGQADNNRYMGNLDLKPEVAHTASAGLRFHEAGQEMKATLFYQRVNDYIVGTPCAAGVCSTTGVVHLRYENHDARLAGLDLAWNRQAGPWNLTAVLSYVQGRNLDSDTDLYRIAPLRLTVGITHDTGTLRNTLQLRAADQQNKVTTYATVGLNDEPRTPGYAVLDWHGRWQATRNMTLHYGVDNLLDKLYYDHLGGINRVMGSDVAVGERLPGAGRFAFMQLEWTL
ncbi:MAG: TonB-dependent receptor [Pseudomonadota bacterium]